MVSLIDLPNEILINIFSLLPRHNTDWLHQLIRLSRNTKPTTELNAYHQITLNNHQTIRSLSKTLRTNQPQLAPLIHQITLISSSTATTATATTTESKTIHDESMTFFAFTALLRHCHRINHLQLELDGTNRFELTQLFQAISDSKTAQNINSLVYLTRSPIQANQPDLSQLISNLTALKSLSIIGNIRYHHHHHHPFYYRQLPSPPPPIQSILLSSSRLTNSSKNHLRNLLRSVSKTLLKLTLNQTSGLSYSALFDFTEPIHATLEHLELIGNFCNPMRIQSTTTTTTTYHPLPFHPDWSLFVARFRILKSLKLVNNFHWITPIPVPISTQQPSSASASSYHPLSSSSTHHIPSSLSPPSDDQSMTNDIQLPQPGSMAHTHYLDFKSLELLPRSIVQLVIRNHPKPLLNHHHHLHHHHLHQDRRAEEFLEEDVHDQDDQEEHQQQEDDDDEEEEEEGDEQVRFARFIDAHLDQLGLANPARNAHPFLLPPSFSHLPPAPAPAPAPPFHALFNPSSSYSSALIHHHLHHLHCHCLAHLVHLKIAKLWSHLENLTRFDFDHRALIRPPSPPPPPPTSPSHP
ncbi:hypothetical protein PGT21_034800 [Puccinia graminis f. sp. tritici]|uniref:F-box domain-containing protein n=1 Tax=Puccinia graminis f. sp. tritici TaxID=56615 RepID=A0A5B0MGS3_PUCGR|nr:hypothetical protein PGTUg99_036100 [Puccinia graminis f. sp. tritici]KAA1091496.1 hypothetical protein PGT21_034800 [Puccinia graminis f. sp. tritici]